MDTVSVVCSKTHFESVYTAGYAKLLGKSVFDIEYSVSKVAKLKVFQKHIEILDRFKQKCAYLVAASIVGVFTDTLFGALPKTKVSDHI